MNSSTLKKAARSTEEHIDLFARVGFLARAFVYALMGFFAIRLFTGLSGGAATDSKGSIRMLLSTEWGKPLIVATAIGLLAYAVFRIFQALRDYDHRGADVKGLLARAGYLLSGIIHIGLAYYALNLIFEFGFSFSEGGGAGSGEQGTARSIMSLPAGRIIVIAVGAGIIVFGIWQIVSAIKEKFTRKLALPSQYKSLLCNVSKFGLIARGLMFGAVGWLFALAGWHGNSSQAGGLKAAWSVFSSQPFGTSLQIIIAFGLVAFAIYGVIESRYRHVAGR